MAQENIILNSPICRYCGAIMIKNAVEHGYRMWICPNKRCKSNTNRRKY